VAVERFARPAVGLAALVTLAVVVAGSAQAAPQGTYVVALKPGPGKVRSAADGLARAHGGAVGFVYEHALHGFSMRMSEQAAAAVARSPLVAYVEADQEYGVAAQSMPTGVARVGAPQNSEIGIDGVDDARVDVDVAVIDSGIDLDHPDLVVAGSVNCVTFFATCGSGGDDGNGHGTHVAGTVGALDNDIGVVGVAPGARLWAVRVLGNGGTGTTSQIVAGIDWVVARASTIEVANLSIEGPASSTVDAAVGRLADSGIAVAVAAGNSDANASNYSPARAAKVLTVSAIADYDGLPGGLSQPPSSFCSDVDDTLWDASNWGSAVEIAAPGCRILSTYLTGGYAWINGTSMAAPHVAGALSLLASNGFARTYAGVSGLYATVLAEGSSDWVDDSGDGVAEPLLAVSDATVFAPRFVGEQPPNVAPTASFSYSCTGLSCSFDGRASSDADGTITTYAWDFGDGSTASGSTASRTFASAGTYLVTLRVTDDDGATGTTSASVPVVTASAPDVSLAGSGSSSGSRWTATVTITVTRDGQAATGLSVTGTWSNGATGSSSCTTGSDGRCSVSKSRISKNTTSVRFTVASIGGSSTFTGTSSITVPRP
jgi:subtilisin family serine protease